MTGKEIHNSLNSAKILRLKSRNPQDKKYSKIAYYINGSWYFNETNTFSSSEEESIGSFQFNGKIINMILPTKFVWILAPRYLTFPASRI